MFSAPVLKKYIFFSSDLGTNTVGDEEYWDAFGGFLHRSTGLGASGQGGCPAGAPSGGAEALREKEAASQTSYVSQDADEDNGPEKHQC